MLPKLVSGDGEFFVFVDMTNPFTWHNITQTRCMVSAGYIDAIENPAIMPDYIAGTVDYLPFVINPQKNNSFASFHSVSATSDYRTEYEAEITRRRYFPQVPSRLSALYAFSSFEDCRKAHQLYRWDLDSVRRFRLVNAPPLTKIVRVNMEIISLMRAVYPKASWDEQSVKEIWSHYWRGDGNLEVEIPCVVDGRMEHKRISSGEIWEYLIEGRLDLIEE